MYDIHLRNNFWIMGGRFHGHMTGDHYFLRKPSAIDSLLVLLEHIVIILG